MVNQPNASYITTETKKHFFDLFYFNIKSYGFSYFHYLFSLHAIQSPRVLQSFRKIVSHKNLDIHDRGKAFLDGHDDT